MVFSKFAGYSTAQGALSAFTLLRNQTANYLNNMTPQYALRLIAQAKAENWKRLDLGNCGLNDLIAQVPQLFELYELEELTLSNVWYEWNSQNNKLAKANSQQQGKLNFLQKLPTQFAQLKNLRKIVCGGNSPHDKWDISDIGPLQTLDNLSELDLRHNKIADVRPLQYLSNLSSLVLQHNQINDVNALQSLVQLMVLDLSYNKVSNLSPLLPLAQLTNLNLSENQIDNISPLHCLTRLNALNLSYNKIEDIYPLQSLTNLCELDLSYNQINIIDALKALKQLTELDLSYNRISDLLPLETLKKIRVLIINENQISDIKPLKNLTKLLILNASVNNIIEINALQKLNDLSNLDLSYNQINDISPLSNLLQLTALDLSENKINDISPLSQLQQLSNLDLRYNRIIDILPLQDLIQLNNLDLRYNRIRDIGTLKTLAQLSNLSLSYNHINDISPLQYLTQLINLDLRYNQIIDISPLKTLINLHNLDLRYNQISDISALQYLTHLNNLYLSYNQIADTTALQTLNQLSNLYLSSNQIQDLTPLLPQYKRHIYINIEGNNITNPPMNVVEEGSDYIIKWLEVRIKGYKQVYVYEAKMLLVGEGNVGKSSLCCRLLDKYADLPTRDERTRGVHIKDYVFTQNRKKFKAHIWDFGGQDIYYELHRFFLSANALYILMTDTRTDQGKKFEEWLQTIELFSNRDSPVIMLQNLIDNAPPLKIDIDALVPYHNIYENRLLAVNLKEKGKNKLLEEVERAICHKLMGLPHIGSPILENWLKVRDALQRIAPKMPIISYKDYEKICTKYGIDDAEEQKILCRYLYNLGILLWYNQPNNRFLRRKIILNPQWIITPIYQLIDSEQIRQNNGKFSLGDADSIWGISEYEPYYNELIELMREFRLCYQHKHAINTFIIPSLMHLSAPPIADMFDQQSQDAWQILYRYKRLMPRGIVNQLAAELHRHIDNDNEHVWAFGVVLHSKDAIAKIKADLRVKEITIKIIGDKRDFLLDKIRRALDDIHDTYSNNLAVEIKIPCTCDACQASKTPTTYNYYEEIILEIEKGRTDIHCRDSRKYVDIKPILQNVGFILPFKLQQLLPQDNTIRLFISYAPEDITYLEQLKRQLAPLQRKSRLKVWNDREILPGKNWHDDIQQELDKANVVIMLISPDFLDIDKNYIWEQEMPKIKERHQNRNIVAIPIILRDCLWNEEDYIKNLQVIAAINPITHKRIPLLSASNQDEAFANAARQILNTIESYPQ